MSTRRFFEPVLLDKPLKFEFDRDTGLLWVTIEGRLFPTASGPLAGQHIQRNVRLAFPQQMSQALLMQLPQLETLLSQASGGPAKPRSVQ